MVDLTSDPEGQTGTGEPRSSPGPSEAPDGDPIDTLRPPGLEETRRQINRSGSGGSGGPVEGDPREEGSGSGSLEDMLAGD